MVSLRYRTVCRRGVILFHLIVKLNFKTNRVFTRLSKHEANVMACAVATRSCISDVPSQWDGQNFDPPLPHFSTDFNETQNQERYPGYDPTRKIWLMWDDGKGVCVGRAFPLLFVFYLSFFVFLLTPTGHTRRPITTVYGLKRVFLRKVCPFRGLDDKK